MGDVQSVALYRKYRGLSFSDIVGQEHITSVLEKAIQDDRVSHAYLFTGPRGVGKTSIARIMAHKINDLDYKKEDNHLDIVEIDAASNRRIDEIRDLREKAYIAPVSAKYKVYIIDEVHMLTKEAFNALLKTLEEPPAHVVFILATTEAHKLPQTIISRTQRHTFKPMQEDAAVSYLRTIAEKEKILIDDEALSLVVRYGDGSFRDAIGLLDQVASLDVANIDASAVRSVLGFGDQKDISELLDATIDGDSSLVAERLGSLLDAGMQPEILADQIIDSLKTNPGYFSNLGLVENLLDIPSHSRPTHKLEVALLRHAQAKSSTSPGKKLNPEPATSPPPSIKPKAQEPKPAPKVSVEPPVAPPIEEPPTSDTPKEEPATSETADIKLPSGEPVDKKVWQDVVARIKTQNNPIASILRSAETKVTNDQLSIGVKFGFHKKKLEASEVKDLVSDAIKAATGNVYALSCYIASNETVEDAKPAEASTPEEDEDDVADRIISTFGGGEKVNL